MAEFQLFGHLSNFKINFGKSEPLGIATPDKVVKALKPNFPFKWATSHIRYLGTNITSGLS